MSYEDLPETVSLGDRRFLRLRWHSVACPPTPYYEVVDSMKEVDHLEAARDWVTEAYAHNPIGEKYQGQEHDHRLQLVINAVKELVKYLEIRS